MFDTYKTQDIGRPSGVVLTGGEALEEERTNDVCFADLFESFQPTNNRKNKAKTNKRKVCFFEAETKERKRERRDRKRKRDTMVVGEQWRYSGFAWPVTRRGQ